MVEKNFKKTSFATIIIIIAMLLNCVAFAHSDNEVFKFVRVEEYSSCEKVDTGPEECWYHTSIEQNDIIVSTGFEYSEMKHLLKYFKVKTPEELVGKTFESHSSDALTAVEYLILVQRHGDKYTPPTDNELYERTALAMSKMDCPDFSDVDKETVANAFMKVWQGYFVNEDWVRYLQNRVSELSTGQVKLVRGDKEKFPSRYNGVAEYLLLTKGEKTIFVIMGPYSTPVTFH